MTTKEKILNLLEGSSLRPAELAESLQISPQALHRHLKALVDDEKIEKIGNPPRVFYRLRQDQALNSLPELPQSLVEFLNLHYANVNALGRFNTGLPAFADWAAGIGQINHLEKLAVAYQKIRSETLQYYQGKPYISALDKIRTTFHDSKLSDVLFQDFYSLPQFGKTRIGHLITMGKSGQYKRAIQELAVLGRQVLAAIIAEHQIDALVFIPHSISRKLLFLPEYRKNLNLNYPEIELVKAFPGGVPVAQKALSKLPERIANARNTIFLKNRMIPWQNILLIDDAIGSGATVNEAANKILQANPSARIFAFAIAGSYKGFDVIPEV